MAIHSSTSIDPRLRNLGNAFILFALTIGGIQLLKLSEFGEKVFEALGFWKYAVALAPAVSAFISDKSPHIPLKTMGQYAAVIAAAYHLSTTMAKLSGTALWIPYELRTMVNLLVSLLGEGVYSYVKNLKEMHRQTTVEVRRSFLSWWLSRLKTISTSLIFTRYSVPPPGSEEQAAIFASGDAEIIAVTETVLVNPGEKTAQNRGDKYATDHVFFHNGLAYFSLAIILFAGFMLLRSRCVKGFDVRDWLAHQHRENALNERDLPLPDQVRVFDGSSTQPVDVKLADYEYHVPEFVDIQCQQIYLPIWFPRTIQKTIDDAGKHNDCDMDGLTYELASSDTEVFLNMIEMQAYWQVCVSNWLFLLLDAAIIAAAAAGMACFFDIAEFLGSVLGGLAIGEVSA